MNLKPVSRVNKTRGNKWLPILMEFLEGDHNVVEVIPKGGEYASPKSLQSSALCAIKRYHLPVKVILMDGRVYMFKKISSGV